MLCRDQNGLQLEVWISDEEGKRLSEYQIEPTSGYNPVLKREEPGVQCWVPSVAGTRFLINWQVVFDKDEYEDENGGNEANLPERAALQDLACSIWLDGKLVSTGVLEVDDILAEKYAIMTGDEVDPEGDKEPDEERPYEFGRLELTDNEDDVPENDPPAGHLNKISIALVWGFACRIPRDRTPPPVPVAENRGPVLKADIQEGNYSSAKVGDPVRCEHVAGHIYKFRVAKKMPTWFDFNHATADWLKAQGIIPPSPRAQALDLKPPGEPKPHSFTRGQTRGAKHSRPKPDCIDVDALDDTEFEAAASDLEDTKPAIPASNRTQSRKRHRPEPDCIDVDGLSESESKIVASKIEPLENIELPTSAQARTRHPPERDYIDVDSFSDSETKSADPKLEPIDTKPKLNLGGFRFTPSIGAPEKVFIDHDISLLKHSMRTEIPLIGPNSNRRFKLVMVYEDDEPDTKPKQEELA